MRLLQLIVMAVFLMMSVVFVFFFIRKTQMDQTYPVITIPDGIAEVSILSTDEELLTGITAWDEKDGDLTDRILIEKKRQKSNDDEDILTYVVYDNDNHVTKADRVIRYSDYTLPRFTLSQPLIYSVSGTVHILDVLGAVDVLDGDISNRISITTTEAGTNEDNSFCVLASVSNERGDTVQLTLPVYLEEISFLTPKITLSSYMIYIKAGEEINPKDFLISAENNAGTDMTNAVIIKQNGDLSVAGVHSVHYWVTDDAGRIGHSVLTVVVEGAETDDTVQ